MAEEKTPPQKTAESSKPAAKAKANADAKSTAAKKPAAKKKKPPAVEDKPFAEFIQQHYIPALNEAFEAQNISDCRISFDQNQVSGSWKNGQRQFTVYFPEENIKEQRAFSWATNNGPPLTIEPFLIDERKITLDLLVFGVIQRLNAQKWLGTN